MKKNLILLLFLVFSFNGFSQKYIFLKTADKLIITKPNGNVVAVSPTIPIELLGTTGISIIQVTNPDLITMTNVDFVASSMPVPANLRVLYNYLTQTTFVASGTTTTTINSADSVKYRYSVRVANPYSVLASDSTKSRYSMRVMNPYTVQAVDSTKYRYSYRVTNPYLVQAIDSTKYRYSHRVTNPYIVQASDSTKYRYSYRVINPYVVQASDSTKLRYSMRVVNPYSVLASDSTKSRYSYRITNPYTVLASDSAKSRFSVRVSNPQVNQLLTTAGFTKITDGTNTVSVKASGVAAASADVAFVVSERPSTALFGANIPTVTAYTTAGNTISTTNCIKVLIENQSTTTNGTITYGGQTIILGYKGNSAGYSSFYAFDSPFDVSSKKYSPFATMVVDGTSSNIYVTKIFAQ